MNTRPEIFDDLFKDQGGRFPNIEQQPQLDYWLYEMRTLVERLQTREKDKPEIYIDLIANTTLDACVTKKEGVYYIGINYGGLYVISDIFFRMLSSPLILPEYGNASIEKTRKIVNAQITDLSLLYLAKHSDEINTPIDRSRTDLAKLLSLFCVNYIAAHEYGHIVLGHIDHLISLKPFTTFFESIGYTSIKGVTPIFQQIKELEADSYAINLGLNQITANAINGVGLSAEIVEKLKDFETRLYLWNFAIYTFWRLFGEKSYSYDDLPTLTHLPPAFRQEVTMGIARTAVKVNSELNYDLAGLSGLLQKSVLDVEKAFSAISDQPINMNAYNYIFHERVQTHYNFVKSQYDSVHSQLSPFARFSFKRL